MLRYVARMDTTPLPLNLQNPAPVQCVEKGSYGTDAMDNEKMFRKTGKIPNISSGKISGPIRTESPGALT